MLLHVAPPARPLSITRAVSDSTILAFADRAVYRVATWQRGWSEAERGVSAVSVPSGATVLLVDDNAELLELLTRTLRHVGHFTVVQAADGAAGLELAFAAHPSCIVIDVVMPGLDGYQLVRALRGDPASADIPIIMLTALAQEHNRLGGLLAGADRYLVKPVKIQDLIAAITQAIALSRDERLQRMHGLTEDDGQDGQNGEGTR